MQVFIFLFPRAQELNFLELSLLARALWTAHRKDREAAGLDTEGCHISKAIRFYSGLVFPLYCIVHRCVGNSGKLACSDSKGFLA